MSVDYSLSALNPIGGLDLNTSLKGATEATKIKQVSKAMEQLFVNQLTAELGKSIDGSEDATEGKYGDFIQQAMTQGVTQGSGFGLAKIIENTLTKGYGVKPTHLPLTTPNTSYHVNHVE